MLGFLSGDLTKGHFENTIDEIKYLELNKEQERQ